MKNPGNKRLAGGFTLIELMVVVAIIAILLGIALPNYRDYMVKTRRADVQRLMVSQAQALERYFTTNGTYQNAAKTACGVADPASDYYTIATACAATTFTITATAGDAQKSDGDQTLDQTGKGTGHWAY